MTKDGGSGHTSGRGRAGRTAGVAGLGRRLPIAVLLLAVTTAGFGAFQAYRSQRSHTTVTASLLQDYGGFAAFTYQQRSSQILIEAIDRRLSIARNNTQFRQGHATEQCLELLLDEPSDQETCDCYSEVAGAYSFFTRIGEKPEKSLWGGDPPDEAVRTTVAARIQEHARDGYDRKRRFAVVHLELETGPAIVAYTLIDLPRIDTAWGLGRPSLVTVRDSVIYGIEVDAERLRRLLADALDHEILLPPSLTRKRPNGEVIAVEVVGPNDRVLFASQPNAGLAFASETASHPTFGGGVVRASVLPEVADQLIIGGLPRDRTPLFVLIFGIAGALAVLAIVQLRREDRLALLRQDFVASVSHELRTPLAQVRLFTETLRLGRTQNDEQRDWALENIDRESHRLANLVDNILHFSRSERGVLSVDTEAGDLAPAVAEAITSFGRLIPSHKARFETRITEPLPVDFDAEAIRQVVLNLLDNAVRYGPSGQTVRVAGERSGQHVRIAVEDEGPGVPPADRERIFEAFKRGDHTLGTVVVGSGIGLSVVREIVLAHGGNVWVENRSGGGARFVFELATLHSAREEHFAPAGPRSAGASGIA